MFDWGWVVGLFCFVLQSHSRAFACCRAAVEQGRQQREWKAADSPAVTKASAALPRLPLAAFCRSEKRRSSPPSRARGLLTGAARGRTQPRCHFSDSAVPTEHRLWGDSRIITYSTGLNSCTARKMITNCMYEIGL